jgi:hypothetical protein
MLTIRWINPESGDELIKEVQSISLKREIPPDKSGGICGRQYLTYTDVSGKLLLTESTDIYYGEVYVMNELGKTIAKYWLNAIAPSNKTD